MQANEAAWYDAHYQQIQTTECIFEQRSLSLSTCLRETAGFPFERGIGSGYGPPFFYRFEMDWMTRGLNALGPWPLSFHPILVFRKSGQMPS